MSKEATKNRLDLSSLIYRSRRNFRFFNFTIIRFPIVREGIATSTADDSIAFIVKVLVITFGTFNDLFTTEDQIHRILIQRVYLRGESLS